MLPRHRFHAVGRRCFLLALPGVAGLALQGAAVPTAEILPIPNGGFEDGLSGWRVDEPAPAISTLCEDRAASGTRSVRIRDDDATRGSWLIAPRVPFQGAASLEVRGALFPVSGEGLGVYVRQYNAEGQCVSGESHVRALGGNSGRWEPFQCAFYTRTDCVALELALHSYNAARVEACLDDLAFAVVHTTLEPPWEPRYRIRPDEKDRLTEADVPGPDGLVYPNWRRVGVDGGIPDVPAAVRVEDFGARPDDDRDDAPALDEACRRVGEDGGGAVLLAPGTYHLDRPVTIRHDGVVVRGAGREQTTVVFRYALPASGIAFYAIGEGDAVGPADRLEVHATPRDLQQVRVTAGDIQLAEWKRSTHSGNTFAIGFGVAALFQGDPPAEVTLQAEATYSKGPLRTAALRVRLHREAPARTVPYSQAALYFGGRSPGPGIPLAEDARRGSREVLLTSAESIRPGDCLWLVAPATPRWKALTRNRCQWGSYREYATRAVSISDNRVRLEQPLRLEFPVVDGSTVQRLDPIRWCGVEDMILVQTENLWINTVLFADAWNCWARGVRVRKTGRFPVHANRGKWCEIRDCVFEDAWFKGGGGTAYAGWQHSWDCLMDGVETFDYRHAPLVQWAAGGCVIRNGVFHNSDGQWHSGWTNENLFENCVITSRRGHGSYGYGMWASPPEDTAHGPNGPRNVVYNCDVDSEKTGLWMGGMNENWMILHNRFSVESGAGVFAKTASFDHILNGNVFVLRDGRSPGFVLQTPDCVGIEISHNRVYGGSGTLCEGAGRVARDENNSLHEATTELPPRPAPAVPSIYEWQQANVPLTRELPTR
ncbi:MAG: right-handed parallel beta-helix repeat-containing protein [Lentisphaeria bacterium]|nr:right-handed parallel beta-helix repeat-containing protein [Lentisphaeria bacterium]